MVLVDVTRRFYAGVAGASLLLIAGCNNKVAERDVASSFIADYKFAVETLELTSDHNLLKK